MKKLFRFSSLALALLCLLVPTIGFAQTSSTTGALNGTVTDNSGGVLPGVTVTVTSPNLQGTRTVVTDAQGQYILPLLPAGSYHAEFALSGIKSQVREGVQIETQRQTRLDVPMTLAVSDTVTVTASQVVVDPTQTTTQQTFKEDHLKYASIGSAGRSYQTVLGQAAGVAGGSNPQVAGSNLGQNTYLVDGLNTSDPVTHTFSPNLAFDAIQEISIQTFGKDAEFGKASGGTINVITKSGGNRFSGSADYRYNDPDFLQNGSKKRPTGIAYFGATPTGTLLRFDKSVQTAKSIQPQGTLGGPIVRDRLWFFGATAKPKTTQQAANVNGFQPGVRAFTGWNTLGKLTFTPIENQTLSLRYFNSHAQISNSQFSSFFRPEADSLQTQHSNGFSLGYDAIISSRWLANVSIGHSPSSLEVLPMSGNLDTPGIVDAGTSIRSGNYTNHQGRTSYRNELVASTTYYLERWGTHAFKIGTNLDKTSFTSFNNSTGNPSLIAGYDPSFCSAAFGFPAGSTCVASQTFVNGVPTLINLSVLNPGSTVSAKGTSFFFQDQWNPIPQLTLRLGLRDDRQSWTSQLPIPTFHLLQPRIGAAYDVLNNGNSIIHAYGGKIMDENQLTLPSFGVQQPTGAQAFIFNATTGKYQYSPGNSSFFTSGEVYANNLKPTFSNEYSLGYTQRIFKNTSLDITGEYKKTKNIFEDYCGILATGGLDACVVTNFPGFDAGISNPLRQDYRAITSKLESRPTSNSNVIVSWTHAKSRGTVEYTQNAGTDFDYYPAHFTNRYGYLTDDARDRVKVDGYYRFPWDITLGGNFYWDSGIPWSVTQNAPLNAAAGTALPYGSYFIEPRGSRRLPHLSQLDLQLQKDFRVGQMKFGLIGTVLNALNKETGTAINGNAGTRAKVDPTTGRVFIDPNQQTGANRLAATFGQYTTFQRPRRYEVGVRFEF
ncbi:MAG: TonB-dependent receptor [Acidobacteria bacterium]|nr:TonB-dependent receptor [Acidobacteriota bacterium]